LLVSLAPLNQSVQYQDIMQRKKPALSVYSRPETLAKLDGRTSHAKLVQGVRADLTTHCGGTPSITQRGLIDRAAWLTLHLAMMDARTVGGLGMTDHDSRQYLAWNNGLIRTLRQLGLKGAAEQPPSLAQHLARHAAGAAA
jgi:hypothetical protein